MCITCTELVGTLIIASRFLSQLKNPNHLLLPTAANLFPDGSENDAIHESQEIQFLRHEYEWGVLLH